jgi:uncharacterized membrane protein SirB2
MRGRIVYLQHIRGSLKTCGLCQALTIVIQLIPHIKVNLSLLSGLRLNFRHTQHHNFIKEQF